MNKTLLAWFTCVGLLWSGSVRAQENVAQRLSLRYTAGGSLMLSGDQRAWLGYAAPGLLSDLQLALRVTPLLAAQVGVAGGVFFSSLSAGALLAPMLGVTLRWPVLGMSTYLAMNGGAAFTGNVVRPFGRAAFGIDWPLSGGFSLGPVLGLDVVAQRDGPGFSDDAVYAWAGLAMGYQPVRSQPLLRRKPIERAPQSPPPAPPPAALPKDPMPELPASDPEPPSPEIAALIDEAVHVSHTELLAPVLFEFDSVDLEPSSIAMLHEVARLLTGERKDIQLLAVIAYADARGSEQYNLELSQRRAECVRDWLVAHGVARERLTIEARGYAEPVEHSQAERAQQQNRRVVFRVLREVRP